MKRMLFTSILVVTSGCASVGGMRSEPLTAGQAEQFDGTVEQVLAAVRAAVVESDLAVEEANQVDGGSWVIIAKKGTSFWSWGELVRVVVAPTEQEGKVWVRVTTKRKMSANVSAKGDYSQSIFSSVRLALAAGGGTPAT